MTVSVYSYTIYHSPNAYLGTVLLRRAVSDLPGVELVRRPICVPRERGLMIADLLDGKENKNAGSYNREDCRRWSERFAIPMSYPDPNVFHERAQRWATSPFDREELPARAFYAADPGKRDNLDRALFVAAWVEGLDVNEAATIGWASERAGLDPKRVMAALNDDQAVTLTRQFDDRHLGRGKNRRPNRPSNKAWSRLSRIPGSAA